MGYPETDGGEWMFDDRFEANARALIAARSVSEDGNLPALDVLEPLCREAGLATQRVPSPDTPERDANLLAGPGGGSTAQGEPLLLVTHTDTVSPDPISAWRTDPFAFTVDGNKAYGLGVADVKLDALCKLEALRRLRDVPLKRPVWFLGTYGEEAGLRGAKAFASQLPFRPRYVLCGEPSELQLYTSHKGYCLLILDVVPRSPSRVSMANGTDVSFEGKAVHSSTPGLGDNAADKAIAALMTPDAPAVVSIEAGASTNTIPGRCDAFVVSHPSEGDAIDLASALAAAARLAEVWREQVARMTPLTDERFSPSTSVANLTRLRGQDGRLEIALDARLLPAHDGEELVRNFVFDLQTIAGSDVDVSVVSQRAAAGMELPDDAELSRIACGVLSEMGLDATPQAKPTSTEAGVFAALGLEVAVFGPSVSVNNAHCANEYALLDQVAKAVDVYEQLILAFCR